jgi:hypothetical protein
MASKAPTSVLRKRARGNGTQAKGAKFELQRRKVRAKKA